MCVIFLAYNVVPEYPLILLANRDEFYDRPSRPTTWWEDEPDVYAGRDLVANGTWLGVTRQGRFAAVTNYRDPRAAAGPRSRGELVTGFLTSSDPADKYLRSIEPFQHEFSPFNLIAGTIRPDQNEVAYISNQVPGIRHLTEGIYGLSNHLLDTPWPKVRAGKEKLKALISSGTPSDESLFEILADRTLAADHELPRTGIAYEREKALSSIFIATADYGTRCSTVVRFEADGVWHMEERTHV